MSMNIFCFYFLLSAFFLSYPMYSIGSENYPQALSISQMTEVTLKNGLRVCLQKSDLEPKEFDFQLFSVGGLASLPIMDQPSAWLAAEIAWESGLDQLTGDELACALDNHSVEMKIKLGLFDRQIAATGPTTELAYCLRLTQLLFTHPQFTENGIKEALTHARQCLQKKAETKEVAEEQTALKINLRNWYAITPYNILDLERVELQKAQKIFKTFFFNPAEFTLVIVGDFEPNDVIVLLEKSLGSLPSHPIKQWNPPIPPSFPEGVTKKEFVGVTRYRNSLTRITFPLMHVTDPLTLDLLCFILKRELTCVAAPGHLEKICFHVSYSFPLFPYLQPCWLVIKFSSPAHAIQPLCQGILKKIEKLKQQGITDNEIRLAFQDLAEKRAEIPNNAYILSLLADFYRANWDIKQIYTLTKQDQQEKEMMKKIIDCYPHLDQYSIISLHP